MRIPRHVFDPSPVQEYLEIERKDVLAHYSDDIRTRPHNLSLLERKAKGIAQSWSVVKPDSPEIGRALHIAGQAGTAIFQVACANGHPVSFSLGEGLPITAIGKVHEGDVEASRWVRTFYLACLCREKELIDSLCQTPTDLLGESSTQTPYYVHTLVDALKEFAVQAPATTDTLEHIFVVMEDEQSRLTKYAYLIDQPVVELLLSIQRDEKETFAEQLPKAVESHKKYWGSSKKLRQDWDGFLSIPLLGISALAYDRGFRFEVESEYLPMHLVRGDFLRGDPQ